MDDQISRTILDNFDVANVENGQNEISKVNAPGVLRSVEAGALHFITFPNREQEFIDHSFLNPEYITTHIPSGFIIDFINGNDHQQQPQFIHEAITNDLEFQNDEQDRKFTATLMQIVNKQCTPVKNGNEAQVIVSNKDLNSLAHATDAVKQTSLDHNFLTIDDQQSFSQSLLGDSQLKIYQNSQSQINVNPPLPPLTPIRRLNSPRKITSVNSTAPLKNEFNTDSINNFKGNHEASSEDVRTQHPLAKKSLPHKKRITKKLKTIDKPVEQQIERNYVYSEEPEDTVEEESIALNTPQFSCQLCGQACESQLDFFTHLKDHYEPVNSVIKTEDASEDKKGLLIEHLPEVDINFVGFSDEILDQSKNETEQNANIKIIHVGNSSSNPSNKDVEMNVTEVEFSDTEDMLEGIRGVVDKVQESGDNDTNDGMDMMPEKSWYTNSALNGEINFKTDVTVNNHISQQSVDNFAIFFKNDLEKGTDPTQNKYTDILPNLENSPKVEDLEDEDPIVDLGQSTNSESLQLERPKSKRKCRKMKLRKDDDKELSENCDSSDSDYKLKPKKRIQCTKCNKLFNSVNALKYHDLSHTGERPHQCEVCGKSFFALSALKVHMRLHSGIKPYQCEFCNRAFRQWGDLKYHTISIHTNEKNFQCEFCGKAFARRYSLVVHRRIHTSERNYKCEFCPKSFRASSYLQNHRKVHTGEKPYACKICGKKFRVSGDLKRHTNIHSREKRKMIQTSTTISREQSEKDKQFESLPEDDVKIETVGMEHSSPESKLDTGNIESRATGLTIFYQDESLDIFKTESNFDHTAINNPSHAINLNTSQVSSKIKHKQSKKTALKDNRVKNKLDEKMNPVQNDEPESFTNDLGKILQKDTNLVCFW